MKLKSLYLAGTLLGSVLLSNVAQATAMFDINAVTGEAPISLQIGNNTLSPQPGGLFQSVGNAGGKPYYGLPSALTLTASDGSVFTVADAKFDPDPFLSFAVTATNNGNTATTFVFTFTTPLLPNLNGLVDTSATMTAILTDMQGNGATLRPLIGHKILESYDLFQNGDNINKNVDIGTQFSIASGTQTMVYNASGTIDCTPSCVNMQSNLIFTLSPHDSVTLVGRVDQTQVVPFAPVPTPNTALLLLTGVAAWMGYRSRQKSTGTVSAMRCELMPA